MRVRSVALFPVESIFPLPSFPCHLACVWQKVKTFRFFPEPQCSEARFAHD
jgi:hypothetical protein